METIEHRGRNNRESSPDRVVRKPTFKKIQVVYYLSRNGNLEHPHYLELTTHQHLRLKDVMERLTVLRGKAMASLYSWSCKRSYKNGYVWNDLAENDVIFPSEGGEYVLKGSEIVLSCTDKLQNLQLIQDGSLKPKRKTLAAKRHPNPQQTPNRKYYDDDDEEEYEEKQTCKSCSRGVSTDEIEEFKQQKIPQIEHSIDANSSPPSGTASTHSDNSSNTLDAAAAANNPKLETDLTRFEDGDPVGIEPMLNRNSMLLSLIACGGSTSFRKSLPPAPPRKSCSSDLHKGVVRKAAAAATAEEVEMMMMINYISENPRLIGNLGVEEKEYFSGSIVEAMGNEKKLVGDDQRPGLKRSSSFNQERSDKAKLVEVAREEEEEEKEKTKKREKGKMKGKCIPRKKACSSSKK